ncbi:MAG: PLP-dependent transferase [Magnetococcales bacterium]|nr:PLP-dependent transferase [Magnetococcales bacterium]
MNPPGPDSRTLALHCRIDDSAAHAAVTPIYQSSAFAADSPYFYSRNDNPNVAELEGTVALLEQARFAVAMASGMATIQSLFELVRPGQAVVLNRLVYGCTFRLFQRMAERRGFALHLLDLSQADEWERIPPTTRLIFLETPTNPFLRTVRLSALVERVRRTAPEALIAVDNTWATPLFQKPLQHGVDISLHSGTKYFSGHSDCMSGVVLTDREDLDREFRQTRFYGGAVLSPESAWLTRRSLQTLEVRLLRQQESALAVRRFLERRPEIARVYYPEVDGNQLTGYGGLIFFAFSEAHREGYLRFRDTLRLFGTGTGMACVTSMVAQPYTGSHASMTDEEKAAIGLGREVVRLSIGLERVEDLCDDLTTALRAL